MSDLFTLSSNALPASVKVVGFRGSEALGATYRFEIGFVLGKDVDLEMTQAVGRRARLCVDRGAGPAFQWNGVLASLEHLHEFSDHALFVTTLVPLAWKLSLTKHSRVFTEKSIPEVIEEVLRGSGMHASDFAFTLSNKYAKVEHVCQFREDNLSFVARLMEREGMYSYFAQEDEGEVFTITDDRAHHRRLTTSPTHFSLLGVGDQTVEEGLVAFKCKVNALSATVQERDYDYMKPKLDVFGSALVAPNASGDIVTYGGNYKAPVDAARYAKTYAEELLARQSIFEGNGRAYDLRPGYRFVLEDHPRAAFNAEYLVTALEHRGNDAAGNEDIEALLDLVPKEQYLSTVTAIPSRVQYRQPRSTPVPRVEGVVDAIVDGSAESPYAQIDAHGRYKVRINFDESGLPDGQASMWVRMLQPHAGNPEGFHFPLRKGVEVHLVFLGGDPDRPVIVGAAHDALHPQVVTAANISQNVIMTKGSNRLEMEDAGGAQYVTLSTPVDKSHLHLGAGEYNAVISTNGNGLQHFGINLDVQVLADKTEDVTGTVKETYLSTLDTTVRAAVSQTYKDTHELNVFSNATNNYLSSLEETVKGPVSETYKNTYTQEVTGLVSETFKASQVTAVTGTQSLSVSGHQQHEVGSHQTKTAGPWVVYSGPMFEGWADGDFKLTAAGGNGLVSAHGTLNLQASGTIAETAVTITLTAGGDVVISGGTVSVTGGSVSVGNGATTTITGGTVNVNGGAVNVTGGPIKLN
jgi:type VI secretion system secreted protein VgrG